MTVLRSPRPKRDRGIGFRFKGGLLFAEVSSYGLDDAQFAIGNPSGGRASGMLGRVRDWSPVFEHIREDWMEIVDERFESEGGGEWEPLSENTKAAKEFFGLKPGPLEASGDLRESLTDRNHPDFYERIDRFQAEFGSGRRTETGELLWEIHDEGTGPYTIRPVEAERLAFVVAGEGGDPEFATALEVRHPGVPARPIEALEASDIERWLSWCQEYAITGWIEPRARGRFRPGRGA